MNKQIRIKILTQLVDDLVDRALTGSGDTQHHLIAATIIKQIRDELGD